MALIFIGNNIRADVNCIPSKDHILAKEMDAVDCKRRKHGLRRSLVKRRG